MAAQEVIELGKLGISRANSGGIVQGARYVVQIVGLAVSQVQAGKNTDGFKVALQSHQVEPAFKLSRTATHEACLPEPFIIVKQPLLNLLFGPGYITIAQ